MQSNLKEILDLLQDKFPKVKEKTLIKIIFTIKARNNQFKSIGFSRCEADEFNIWEKTLQNIIYFLRDFWILELKWRKLRSKWTYLCNIYNLSQDFIKLFDSLEFFAKRVFEYIDPIIFMKRFFSFKFDNKEKCYKFKVNWNRYIIAIKWRFANKIYWIEENKLINPFSLLT